MNILFIAPRLPLPADSGGKIRTWNILKQLAKKAKIHLVCFSFDEEGKDLCTEVKNAGIDVTLIPAVEPNIVKKIIQVLFSPFPVSMNKYYSKEMEGVLTELNETNHFDAVHIDHLHMAHYVSCFNGLPCVMDEHNVEYKILERCANVEKSFIKRAVFKNQARKIKNFEEKCVKDVSAYLAVSKDDQDLLYDLGGDRLSGHVIPNGVDTQYFRVAVPGGDKKLEVRSEKLEVEEEDALVFTGSMDWFPNDDSAIYFCEDILPLIWKTKPDIKFYIVGKGPSDRLKDLTKGEPRIVLTGRVDDVRTYVNKSKIFVVPLRIGGGTRLKILEAMSMEKVVVSTSIGAEGIDYTKDGDIVLADEPQDFAQKVVSLLDDSKRRAALESAGRKLVLEKYDWNIVGKKLLSIYERIKT